MAEREYWKEDHPVIQLRVWVLGQMVWGAFLAGVFVVGIAAVLVAIWAVGLLLPPESKEAPSPYGALEISQPFEVA